MNTLAESIIIGQHEAAPFYGGQNNEKIKKKTSQRKIIKEKKESTMVDF